MKKYILSILIFSITIIVNAQGYSSLYNYGRKNIEPYWTMVKSSFDDKKESCMYYIDGFGDVTYLHPYENMTIGIKHGFFKYYKGHDSYWQYAAIKISYYDINNTLLKSETIDALILGAYQCCELNKNDYLLDFLKNKSKKNHHIRIQAKLAYANDLDITVPVFPDDIAVLLSK